MKTAYKFRIYPTKQQEAQLDLTIEKQQYPELKSVHVHVLQDVLRRLKNAMDNFFRRVRQGAKKKGYPRFKGKGRYNSFTYP